jgi:hypothetical protein
MTEEIVDEGVIIVSGLPRSGTAMIMQMESATRTFGIGRRDE